MHPTELGGLGTLRQEEAMSAVDVNAVIDGLHPLLQRIAGSFVNLETVYDPSDLWVAGDSDQIEQLLLSLVVHASDAMPLGGKLVVATRRWNLRTEHRHRHGVIPAGRWVVIRVTDSGTGLDDPALARLLGVPLNEKDEKGATGLDLATVFAVSQRAGGHVLIDDRGEHGASISVCFPAHDLPPRRIPGSRDAAAVLIVDGDEWARTNTAHVLRRAGYGVLQADQGTAALELLRGVAGSCVRLMVVALDLPDMNGRALALTARRVHSTMPVIFMSDGGATPAEASAPGVLAKPFSAHQLLGAVTTQLRRVAV